MTGPGYQSWQSFQQATHQQNHMSSQLSHQNAVRAHQHAVDSSRRAQYHYHQGRTGGSLVGRLFRGVVSLASMAFAFFILANIAERGGIDLTAVIKDLFLGVVR